MYCRGINRKYPLAGDGSWKIWRSYSALGEYGLWKNILMVILMGRGSVVKYVRWRGYVVSKVGIELLGQLKMWKVGGCVQMIPFPARQ